jgi:hypothetical protein
MASVDLAGIGVYSERYTDWPQFCAVMRGEEVEPQTKLAPELIAPRERRRAPAFVKMAVEVMDQACKMADADRGAVAQVFASGMSDMQITDYMCRTLATMPATVSPTKFHNSVHNASTGYWSIATGSHRPSNAVSGYDHSAAIALMEGALQAADEDIPVLVTVQEMAAPVPFQSVYASEHPLAVALLLTPAGKAEKPLARLSLAVEPGAAQEAAVPESVDVEANFSREIIGLLVAAASGEDAHIRLELPGSATMALTVEATDG